MKGGLYIIVGIHELVPGPLRVQYLADALHYYTLLICAIIEDSARTNMEGN